MLLAYYLAAIKIEEGYRERTGDYELFEGIVLTDTFLMNDNTRLPEFGPMGRNSTRVKRQNDLPIEVIVGDPPWSADRREYLRSADAGVSRPTVSEWLAVLEASDIVFRLRPFHANIRKRLTRSPKLYFHDVGLASYLLGIESPRQLVGHPLRGALFENAAVSEAVKSAHNRARRPRLSFFRDRSGFECDLICETPAGLAAIEIKSGRTIASDWFDPPRRLAGILPEVTAQAVVYGGDERQVRTTATAVPLADFAGLLAEIHTSSKDPSGPEV